MVSLRAITSWKKKLGIVVVVVAVVQLLFVFSTNTAATGEEDSRAGLPLASQTTRRLQTYELIGSYEPVTLVTDENAIDLDLDAIRVQLGRGTDDGFRRAKNIYTQGAFSRSVANLTLLQPLSQNIPAGMIALGTTARNAEVKGKTIENSVVGTKNILVQYDVNKIQENYVGCQVGANPTPNTQGCFHNQAELVIGDQTLYYEYNAQVDNINLRTLQSFSTKVKDVVGDFWTLDIFSKFFGSYDYADMIIMGAFDGLDVGFPQGNESIPGGPKLDLSSYNREHGIADVIQNGIAFMSAWMYSIAHMEKAVHVCKSQDGIQPSEMAAYWDVAVAYYTGSRVAMPDHNGYFTYSLANQHCSDFRTCGDDAKDTQGIAYSNIEVFRHFTEGKIALMKGECEKGRVLTNAIITKMTIPLIQSTLRYAFEASLQDLGVVYERHQASAALFALSILPFVSFHSKDDANTIYENMVLRSSQKPDFRVVKETLESQYERMGIKCHEVGGLYNAAREVYEEGAAPCASGLGMSDAQKQVAIIFGVASGGLVLAAFLVYCISRKHINTRSIKSADTIPSDIQEEAGMT